MVSAVVTGSAASSAGGCQLSSSSSGYGCDGPALAGALGVHRGVDRDPVQPRLDAAAAEAAQVAEGAEERLLRDVGRLVAVRDHPHDEREQLVLVQPHEIVERLEIALAGALEQDEVAALDRVVDDGRRTKVLHRQKGPPDGECGARRV